MASVETVVNKYDRQIRIWGDDGQSALQQASICIIGATSTATEILKNLVLPGIAAFTIVDGQNIALEDYATNFFLNTPDQPATTTSTSRAEAVVNSMYALNDSVRGSYIPADASTFLTSQESAQSFLRSFSFVIITQRSFLDSVTLTIAKACATLRIPLLLARAYGQIAIIRLQLSEHCVQNARTADAPPDLRLYSPFQELLQHCTKESIAKTSEEVDESHIPFVHILVRALQTFRKTHENRLPQSRAEKNEFAKLVRESRSKDCPSDAQNYVEALRYAHLRLCHAPAAEIPTSVMRVIQLARDKQITPSIIPVIDSEQSPALPKPIRFDRRLPSIPTANYETLAKDRAKWWTCAKGVAKFYDREKVLPISGSIPDMTADTVSYIALQRVYRAQAEQDAESVCREISTGTEENDLGGVTKEMVKSFCKRVREIQLVETRTIEEEITNSNKSGFLEAAQAEGSLDESLSGSCASPFYAALRASDIFESEFFRLPGTIQAFKSDDTQQMHVLMSKVKEGLGASNDLVSWRDVTEEMVRYAGVETHCVAAFIGGVAAQEIIKVITGQFVPIEGCIVFNMANMSSATFAA